MKKIILCLTLFLFPVVNFATAQAQTAYFSGFIGWATGIGKIMSILLPVTFGLALVALFWGVAKYIFSAGDEKSQISGKNIMVGGVIGIFVISAIWGIVSFISLNFLGVDGTKLPVNQAVPTVKF